MTHDLAQVNIARLAFQLDSPELRPYVDALTSVDAEAEQADGFRWRLRTGDGSPTVSGFADDEADGVGVVTNLSTWRDLEALTTFVYGPVHRAVMSRRREWFLPIRESYLACWWVPAGHRPSVDEAEARISTLRRLGPSPEAFTVKHSFEAPCVETAAAG